jgi:predicted transcriptional regulator
MKFKTLWCSLFQAQHTATLKQMKPVDSSTSYENDSNEYRSRREKNNESVRKTRAKNRAKLNECANHVQNLKNENIHLNKTLNNLESELYTLKGLFQHCFSFDLNSLSFKPSDIPTSTLYKIIMNRKDVKNANFQSIKMQTALTAPVNNNVAVSSNNNLMVKKNDSSIDAKYNETDKFYINQIKNALSNLVKDEKLNNEQANNKLSSGDLNTVQLVNDHNYSLKQNKYLTTN